MAAPKKAAPEAPAESAPAVRRPSPAESSDPTVHQLLGERQTLQMNIAHAQADLATIKDAEIRLAAVDKALADLGYE